jgi:hypothetical protein
MSNQLITYSFILKVLQKLFKFVISLRESRRPTVASTATPKMSQIGLTAPGTLVIQ